MLEWLKRLAFLVVGIAIGAVFVLIGTQPTHANQTDSVILFDYSGDLYTIYPDGTGLTKLTDGDPGAQIASWSSDGQKILYNSNRSSNSNYQIFMMNADGTDVRQISNSDFDVGEASLSPDGRQIVYTLYYGTKHYEIHIMNADGSNPRPLVTPKTFGLTETPELFFAMQGVFQPVVKLEE